MKRPRCRARASGNLSSKGSQAVLPAHSPHSTRAKHSEACVSVILHVAVKIMAKQLKGTRGLILSSLSILE